jgi:hypothetical protein
MRRSSGNRVLPRIGKVAAIAAVLLCGTALSQPNPAIAGPNGGGGFHGGGGGFHGGGVGGFHGGFAGAHAGFGARHDGFGEHHDRDGRFFGGLGLGGWPYGWDYSPDYGYYDYSQPYSAPAWYYCANPAGYYPYVQQCYTSWQTVPAS